MGKQFSALDESHQHFIKQQKLFFVATATHDSRINLSPKGMDSLRVLDANRVVWLNLTGSGNETAAHLIENNRMTIMFCAFEGDPMILRLYGHARVIHPRDDDWHQLITLFPNSLGARQLIDMNIDLVQSSCGFSVPLYDYQGDRDILTQWAEKKGEAGVKQYWKEKNQVSLDGRPTYILDEED